MPFEPKGLTKRQNSAHADAERAFPLNMGPIHVSADDHLLGFGSSLEYVTKASHTPQCAASPVSDGVHDGYAKTRDTTRQKIPVFVLVHDLWQCA